MSQFRLHHTAPGYRLIAKDPALSDVQVDFSHVSMQRRQRSIRSERIVKAVQAAPGRLIVDCTAGLGTDSFLVASAGAHVESIERSHPLYLLLQSALAQDETSVAERIQLHRGDAVAFLTSMTSVPDGVLIDPMYPPPARSSSRKAKAKGALQVLHAFVGPDDGDQIQTLFHAALGTGCRRIVVKRPRWAPTFTDKKPLFVNDGRSNRLEVYSA